MARAVLRIEADTSAVVRAMGDLRGVARSAQAAMTAESRREATQRDRIARDETRHQQRLELESLRATRAASKARTQVEIEGLRDRSRAADRASREEMNRQNTATRLFMQAERLRTNETRRQERERTNAAEAEGRRRSRAEERNTRDIARVRRQAALETRRYEDDLDRRRGRTVGRVTGAVGRVAGAGMSFATGLHGDIQSERRTRALANRNLTHTLEGAGLRGFGGQARRRISEFVGQTGMNYADVVAALQEGQERGSALELRGRTPETALNDALSVVRQANATNTNAGALLAARGRIGGQGITGANLDELMRFVQFAADRGNVEVDQIIQQGLPGALRLMSSRTGAMTNATPQQRQTAAVAAFRESVAAQEVFAGGGVQAGRASNTFASLQSFMTTPRRQDLMRANLENYARSLTGRDPATQAQRAAVMGLVRGPNALYEDDPTRRGARRLRADIANNPLTMSERVMTAMGGNAQAAANIFAGGGHGNAQALLSNMRNALEFIAATNPESGRTRADAIRDIAAGGYTEQDIGRRQDTVEGDDLANINRNEEERAKALTDNTSALVRMSTALDSWTQAHPIAAQAGSSSVGLLGGVGSFLLGTGTRAALPAITNTVGTLTALSSAGGLVGGAVNVLGGLLAGGLGLGAGSLANNAIYSDETTRTVDGQQARVAKTGGQPAYTNAVGTDFWRGLGTSIVQAFESAGASGKIRVSMDSHDVTHATTQAANAPSRTTR